MFGKYITLMREMFLVFELQFSPGCDEVYFSLVTTYRDRQLFQESIKTPSMGGGRDSSLSATYFLQKTFLKTNDPNTNV